MDSPSPEQRSPPRGGRRGIKRRITGIAILLLAVAILAWQVQRAGPAEIYQRLLGTRGPWLWLIVALVLARYAVASFRLGLITRRLRAVRLRAFIPIYISSQVVTLITPGFRVGGTLLRAHLAHRRFGGGLALHLGPNVLDQVTLVAAWIVAALALAPAAAGGAALPSSSLILLGVGLCLLLGVFLSAHRYRRRLTNWLEQPRHGWRQTACIALRDALQGTGALAGDAPALSFGLVGGLLFVVLTGAAQYVAFVALGEEIGWQVAMLAVIVGATVGTASGTPGGIGTAEAAQVVFLQGHGLAADTATAAVLLARGVYYAVVLVAGGAALGWEARQGNLRGLLGGGASPPSANEPAGTGEDVPVELPHQS